MEITLILTIVALIGTILPLILKILEAFKLRAQKEKITNIEIEFTSKKIKELILEEKNKIDKLILDIEDEDKELTKSELEQEIINKESILTEIEKQRKSTGSNPEKLLELLKETEVRNKEIELRNKELKLKLLELTNKMKRFELLEGDNISIELNTSPTEKDIVNVIELLGEKKLIKSNKNETAQ